LTAALAEILRLAIFTCPKLLAVR
jgi:hypothetical protein